jgi:hypothetical protein
MNYLPEDIYLHLGAHRTGSTSFQDMLGTYEKTSSRGNILVSTAPREGNDFDRTFRSIFADYIQSRKALPLFRYWITRKVRKQLHHILGGEIPDIWIFSEENLLDPIVSSALEGIYPKAKDNLKALKILLKDRVRRIGLSIRRYDQFLFSAYLMQGFFTPTDLSKLRQMYIGSAERIGRGWLDVVDALKMNFPDAELCLWIHEETPVEMRLDDFLDPLNLDKSSPAKIQKTNLAPTVEAIEEIRLLRATGVVPTGSEKIRILMENSRGRKFNIDEFFTDETMGMLQSIYRKHLRELKNSGLI